MKLSGASKTFLPGRAAVALAAFATVSCAMLAVPAPAAAESLAIRYSVRLLGLPLGSAGLSGTLDPDAYKIRVDAKLTGLASLVSNSQGAASASGAVVKGRVAPATYANTSANSKETRTVRMAMTAGTVRGVEIVPPFEDKDGRIPLTDEHRRNIVDPLSALVMQVPGDDSLVGPAACNRTLPVFDGYTRFDVTLAYKGSRQVKTKGYSGPVAVCSARYRPVAGHRPNRKGTQFMANNRDMEVWLAPFEGTRNVVPYRISVATMIGTVVIEASDMRLGSSGEARSQ